MLLGRWGMGPNTEPRDGFGGASAIRAASSRAATLALDHRGETVLLLRSPYVDLPARVN